MEEIQKRAEKDERVLVTTLTKRMAEELDEYLRRIGIRVRYIHSDVDTGERVEIIEDFKNGLFDVLVGVNLLREGLDLPSVSLVAILDADKEGFLRSHRSLTQTAGRAARNVNGRVIMYADTITESMQLTIDETNRRRNKQLKYNEEHGITPKQIVKAINVSLNTEKEAAAAQQRTQDAKRSTQQPKPYMPYMESESSRIVADPIVKQMSREQLQKSIDNTTALMQQAAAELDFLQAAQYRDEILRLQALLDEKPATNS